MKNCQKCGARIQAGNTCKQCIEKYHNTMVSCAWCNEPTKMTETKCCDNCYELERRIKMDPSIANRILRAVNRGPIDKIDLLKTLDQTSDDIEELAEELLDYYSIHNSLIDNAVEHISNLNKSLQDDLASLRAYIVSING